VLSVDGSYQGQPLWTSTFEKTIMLMRNRT